jgi:hypothetical protein
MDEIPLEIRQELRMRITKLRASKGDVALETEIFREFMEELIADGIKITPKIRKYLIKEIKRIFSDYVDNGGKVDELLAGFDAVEKNNDENERDI